MLTVSMPSIVRAAEWKERNPCESVIHRLMIVVTALRLMLKTSAELRLENLALRHQLAAPFCSQTVEDHRHRPAALDLAAAFLAGWKAAKPALVIVRPETVVAWHRTRVGRVYFWRSGT